MRNIGLLTLLTCIMVHHAETNTVKGAIGFHCNDFYTANIVSCGVVSLKSSGIDFPAV